MFSKNRHTAICFIFTTTLFAFASPVHATPPDNYQSGFTRVTIDDPMGGSMKLSIWYPTLENEQQFDLGPFRMSAAKNAIPTSGQFGLIVISHGTGGSDLGHRDVASKLSRNGFIVAAPLHPRNNFRDNSGLGHRIVWEGRPKQLSAVIDYFLHTESWTKHINTKRIGAFGFSYGGYTVLSMLGAQHHPLALAQHCERNPPDPLCQNFGDLSLEMRKIYTTEYKDPPNDLTDRRIKAAVLADPMTGAFTDIALANIHDIPLSLYLPQFENELSAEFHGKRLLRVLDKFNRRNKPVSQTITGAHHFSFISPFPASIAQSYPRIANDRIDFDRVAFHQRLANEVITFFEEKLD